MRMVKHQKGQNLQFVVIDEKEALVILTHHFNRNLELTPATLITASLISIHQYLLLLIHAAFRIPSFYR